MNGKIRTNGDVCEMDLYNKKEDSIVGTTIFSKKHKHRIAKFRWYLHIDRHGLKYTTSGKIGKLHRFILDAPKGMVVDHINHDTLDNRDINIRICTQLENNRNTVKRKDNTSGHPGIYWNKENKRWRVEIGGGKRRRNYGSYKNLKDAIEARKIAEKEIW